MKTSRFNAGCSVSSTCCRRSASSSEPFRHRVEVGVAGVHKDPCEASRRCAVPPGSRGSLRTSRPVARRRAAASRICVDLPEPSTPSNVTKGMPEEYRRQTLTPYH